MQPFSCGQNLRQKLNSSDDGASLQQTADREIIKHMCKDDRRYAPTKENQVELYLIINQHQYAFNSQSPIYPPKRKKETEGDKERQRDRETG